MAFKRSSAPLDAPTQEQLTEALAGIGMGFAAGRALDPNIEDTLLHASVEGMPSLGLAGRPRDLRLVRYRLAGEAGLRDAQAAAHHRSAGDRRLIWTAEVAAAPRVGPCDGLPGGGGYDRACRRCFREFRKGRLAEKSLPERHEDAGLRHYQGTAPQECRTRGAPIAGDAPPQHPRRSPTPGGG
jgi:hypothetical protein